MVYAHDGRREHSVATVRAGDGSFLFLSRPALDFADTGGVDGYESLTAATDLQRWVRAAFRLDVDVTDDGWKEGLALRRAIWELVRANLRGLAKPTSAISVINTAARRGSIARQLDRSARRWHWERPASLHGVLSAVARDAIDVLAVEDRSRLRECAAGNCALVFYDDSRSGRRRWCAAQRCGDRTRARTYRSRQKTTTQETTTR